MAEPGTWHAKSQSKYLTLTILKIPKMPNFARQFTPDAKPEHTNPIPEFYPQEGNPPQGWGLSFMLTIEPGATGRGANTAWWAGIANLFWWVDREKGVAGMIASQVSLRHPSIGLLFANM